MTEREKQDGPVVKGGDDGDDGAVRMELEEGGGTVVTVDPGAVRYQPDRLPLRSELLWELVVLKSCDWLCGILLHNPSANR